MVDSMFVASDTLEASANFIPTTASYTAGNTFDTAKEFVFLDKSGLLVPNGCMVRLLSAVIKIDAAVIIAGEGSYTAQVYSVTPPSARANNTVWARASVDLPAYRGSIVIGTPVFVGGTGYLKTQFSDQQDFKLAGNSLFLELTNSGTFTGAAIARQIFLYGIVL
jgi:hypothetical protein